MNESMKSFDHNGEMACRDQGRVSLYLERIINRTADLHDRVDRLYDVFGPVLQEDQSKKDISEKASSTTSPNKVTKMNVGNTLESILDRLSYLSERITLLADRSDI